MSTTSPRRSADTALRENPPGTGLALFAGVMMIITGVNQVLLGISALLNDNVYVRTPNYVYSFDLTAWGWIHLLFGILLVATGFGVLMGQGWGRAVGIGLVSLNLIANFLFLPYFPLWSLLLIALDGAIIWALAVSGEKAV
jgi:hypothetical protein